MNISQIGVNDVSITAENQNKSLRGLHQVTHVKNKTLSSDRTRSTTVTTYEKNPLTSSGVTQTTNIKSETNQIWIINVYPCESAKRLKTGRRLNVTPPRKQNPFLAVTKRMRGNRTNVFLLSKLELSMVLKQFLKFSHISLCMHLKVTVHVFWKSMSSNDNDRFCTFKDLYFSVLVLNDIVFTRLQ